MSITDMAAVSVVAGLLYATTKQTSKSKLATNQATKKIPKVYEEGVFEQYNPPKQGATEMSFAPSSPKSVSMKQASLF